MDETVALRVIEALANGVHPGTGELVAQESPLHQIDVVRALWLASRALVERRHRLQRQKVTPSNVGKAWDEAQEAALIEQFQQGKTVSEIAALHQRTTAGIQARLEKVGLVPAS